MEIYTDGACKGNPGKGGWGVFIENYNIKLNGFEENTTNNRMELRAVIEVLNYLLINNYKEKLNIYTDSQYVKKGITEWIYNWKNNGWKSANKKQIKNMELWKDLYKLSNLFEIQWKWIKGHSGILGNDTADLLANSFNS